MGGVYASHNSVENWPRFARAIAALCGSLTNRAGKLLAVYSRVEVRLTRKLAECLDGVDLSSRRVGEVFSLPLQAARLLIAEGWAEMIERRTTEAFWSHPRRRRTDALLAS